MSEWRDVSGYEGHYQISRNGQDRSLKRGVRVMRPAVNRKGYWQVNFYRDGQPQHFYLHRLVAAAFIGHRFWTVAPDQYANQLAHFWKDITIVGAFLVLFVAGPGALSVDRPK